MTELHHSEKSRLAGWSFRSWWFYGAVGICGLILLATLAKPLSPALLKPFDLDKESNLATLWSGMLLLVTALHAFDGWAAQRTAAPALARAWLVIALVMAGLSLDEVGAFHERVAHIGDFGWLALFPFAAVFGAMIAYALFVLYRSPGQVVSARLLTIGFLFFVAVAIQVEIETFYEWSGYGKRLRTSIEEGTELLGILFILKATMGNTKGMLGEGPRAPFPVFEAIEDLRKLILVGGFLAAIFLAYLSLFLASSEGFKQHGQPTAWLAAALFVLTAIRALWPLLRTGRRVGWRDWSLVALAAIACAGTVLHVQSLLTLPLMTIIASLASAMWIFDPRLGPRRYVPAMALLAVVFAAAWWFPDNRFFAYCVAQFVALAFFYVIPNPDVRDP